MSDARTLLEDIYQAHTEAFIANAFEAQGARGVMITDLLRKPAEANVVYQRDDEDELKSFTFREIFKTTNLQARLKKLQKTTINVIDSGLTDDELDALNVSDLTAAQTIHTFGLFGAASNIGTDAYDSFCKRVEIQAGDQKDDVLELVDAEKFAEAEARRLRSKLSVFDQRFIHKDALDALKASDQFDWGAVSFYGRGDEAGLLRRQAASVYPMMAEFFSNNSVFSRHVIQKKQPLNAELASVFGIKEKSLKRLRGATYPLNGLTTDEVISYSNAIPPDWFPKTEEDWESFSILSKTVGRVLGDQLSDLVDNPIETLFKGSKGNWREFHERCAMAFMDDRPPEGLTEELQNDLKNNVNWKSLKKAARKGDRELDSEVRKQSEKFEYASDREKEAVETWFREDCLPDMSENFMDVACHETLNMIRMIRDHVVIPASAKAAVRYGVVEDPVVTTNQKAAAERATMKLLFIPDTDNPASGKAAPNIFEATRYFVNDLARIQNELAGGEDYEEALKDSLNNDGEWPRLFNGFAEAPNGMYFEALVTGDDLTAEGNRGINPDGTEGLRHCVGGYSNRCKDGQHILSLRRKTDTRAGFERVATLQVTNVSLDSGNIQTGQFYGRGNTFPGTEAEDARQWLRDALKSGEIQINARQIETYDRAYQALVGDKDDVEQTCLYDWRDDDKINAAMMAVGRVVHKNITKSVRNVDDLIEHGVLEEAVDSIDPIGAAMRRKRAPAA